MTNLLLGLIITLLIYNIWATTQVVKVLLLMLEANELRTEHELSRIRLVIREFMDTPVNEVHKFGTFGEKE